ncbi:MAG: hypothetical protein M9891_15930 [Austwickia sp.]|nr:hypothetical protein [Actinomycetota bacterium]MCB1252141.1 hypothetical protein [Austwickia sp.]MCO5310741.1 hypothetical protein [Austwickia sp.]
MGVHLQTTEVVAVVATIDAGVPQVLTIGAAAGVPALPSGPLLADHRSLQAGLRAWVESQTGLRLGFVEQLYTFGDRERAGAHQRVISVSYVALARPQPPSQDSARWRGWYELLPWEDRRSETSDAVVADLRGALHGWADAAARPTVADDRRARIRLAFGADDRAWRPEDCLTRYELLWEASLLAESGAAGPGPVGTGPTTVSTGPAMLHDHRRIVATAMARLRGKLQYRPVVFELLPDAFTLGQLQQVVEALSGTRLHKQNFRRLVESEDLVEETGERTTETGGRPARLMRFRADVLSERPSAGLRLPQPRQR